MTFIFFVLSIGYLVGEMDRLKSRTGMSSVVLLACLFVYSIFAYENIFVIFITVAIIELVKGCNFYGKSYCR